ncbi:hypothetical protein FRC02_006400, partial [Tulasnella sp. 418]
MDMERGIGEIRGGVTCVRDGVERLEERLEVGSKGVEQELKQLTSSFNNDMSLLGKGVGRIENMLEYMGSTRVSASEEEALNAIHPRVNSALYDS